MVQFVPVEGDPFAQASPTLVPVDGDPFADKRSLKDIRNEYLKALSAGDKKAAGKLAEDYVRKEKVENPLTTGIGDRVRQVAKGVPILGGIADEANAAFASIMPGGPSYDEALDYQRARDRVFEADRPKESFALQLGGGLASGVGAAAKVAPVVGNMTRAAILGTGAGGGAVLGAGDGFTRGEGGAVPRLQQAALGGAVGGTIGLAAPVVAKGVASGVGGLLDTLTANKQFGKLGLSRPSADILTRGMTADATLGGLGERNIQAAGRNAMLADAGPNAAGLLDSIIQRGGQGANKATQAVQQRARLANQDIAGAMNRTLGQPTGLLSAEAAIRDTTKAARKSAYNAAYNTPIDYTTQTGRQIEDILSRVPEDAIARANQLMKIKGEKSRQIIAKIANDGTVSYERLPDVRQLDYITRALNDTAKTGEAQGALGGQTALGSALESLSSDIRGLTKKAVPAYEKALETAADPIRRREALQFGASIFSPKTTRDEVARTVKAMTGPERQAAMQGLRTQIDDAVANIQKVASDPNLDAREATKALREMSTRSAREKIETLVGPSSRDLFKTLDEAARSLELRAATANNSKTFARTVIKEQMDTQQAPGALGTLMQGSPVLAMRRGVQGLLGTRPQDMLARNDRVYNEVAQALTGPRGAQALDMLRKIQAAYQTTGQNSQAAQAAGLLAGGATAGLYPSIYQTIPKQP